MLHPPRPETRHLVDRVESETGLGVRLLPAEPYYPARTQLSRYLADPTRTQITISYNPRCRSPDYAVAHEAARFLRFWRAPPGERHYLVSSAETRKIAYRRLDEDLYDMHPRLRALSRHMLDFLYDNLATQLYSTPGDFWINRQLFDEYPGLRAEQEAGLSEIFEQAHQALRPEVKAFAPRTVYRASNAMNAAFAGFAAELLDRDEWTQPYRGTEFADIGSRLRHFNQGDHGHAGDKETADKWATELGLEGWYEWRVAGPDSRGGSQIDR